MKKKIFTLLALVMMTISYLSSTASAQNRIFQKYDNMDNVEYICITRSMMKLMGNSSVNINGINMKGLTDNIKVLIIVNSSNEDACKLMKEDFRTLKGDSDYEMLMQAKNDDNRVTMLFNEHKSEKELVMYIEEDNEQTFIILSGKLNQDIVNKLIAN